jgi:hypothetical protein
MLSSGEFYSGELLFTFRPSFVLKCRRTVLLKLLTSTFHCNVYTPLGFLNVGKWPTCGFISVTNGTAL